MRSGTIAKRPEINVGARGFILLDAMTALGLTVALLIALTIVIGRQHRASIALMDSRCAYETAEAALLNLQSSRAPQNGSALSNGAAVVTFERTADKAAPGYVWIKAKAVVGRSAAEVFGMVPKSSAPSDRDGGDK